MREQRKVVTALFADVVGSTPFGESLDPEDFMEFVGGAVSRMVAPVERFGGTIKDLAGDGLLALFGAPAAHEDDPERAVRAGLAIIDDIAAYAADAPLLRGREPLMVRVGIETGLVVLGQVGGGGRIEQGAMGDSVNTAARLQSAAQPGAVVVGPVTFERVNDLFEWEGPLPLTLKGKAETVKAYRAVRPRLAPAIAPHRIGRDLPVLGRDREVAALRSAADRLRVGTGGVLLVTGEAGIGKSRILAELRRILLEGEGARAGPKTRWLEGRCRSYGESTPYAPVQDMLTRWLERETGTRSGAAWRKAIETWIAPGGSELVPILQGLIPLPQAEDETEAMGRLSPEDRQRRTREAVSALLRGLGAGPLVVAVEDLHWADPSSLGLLEHVLPLSREMPALFALSARSDDGPWQDLRKVAARIVGEAFVDLPLEPLADQADAEMLSALVGSSLPERLRARLLEAAGGNPFYLEEVVRSLVDQGFVVMLADGRWQLETDASVEIPATVEQVLMSRIDALPRLAHEALTAAAVVGAQFGLALLEAVTEDPAVGQAMADLERADLVRLDPEVPGEYRFKHALIQETAYRSLLKRRRRELHGATARALQGLFKDRTEEIAGSLAHHLMQAGDLSGALHHGTIAGDRSAARFANTEAIASYRLALDAGRARRRDSGDTVAADPSIGRVAESLGQVLTLVGRHPEARDAFSMAVRETAPERSVDLARLERRVGETLQVEYRSEDVLAQYERAERILDSSDPARRDGSWWEEWLNVRLERMATCYWTGRVEEMAMVEREVRPVVEARATRGQRARYLDLATDLRFAQNRYRVDDETMRLARAHLSVAEEIGDLRQVAKAQFDVAFCELFQGDLDAAEARLHESLAGAERVGDAVGRLRSLAYLSLVARLMGQEDLTAERSDELSEASTEAGVDVYVPLERANRAWLAWRTGDRSVARRRAEDALAGWAVYAGSFPFQWAARWVLLAVAATEGDVPGAIEQSAGMLAPEQQALPDPVTFELEAAQQDLSAGKPDGAQRHLEEALRLARGHGYL